MLLHFSRLSQTHTHTRYPHSLARCNGIKCDKSGNRVCLPNNTHHRNNNWRRHLNCTITLIYGNWDLSVGIMQIAIDDTSPGRQWPTIGRHLINNGAVINTRDDKICCGRCYVVHLFEEIDNQRYLTTYNNILLLFNEATVNENKEAWSMVDIQQVS